jgi:hypothetical protein
MTDSLISFTIRPVLTGGQFKFGNDTLDAKNSLLKLKSRLSLPGNRGYLQLLPLSLQHQYNTILPYDWNDGAMIPAKGNQTHLSFGAFFKYGPSEYSVKTGVCIRR